MKRFTKLFGRGLVAIVLLAMVLAILPRHASAGSPSNTTPNNGTQFTEQQITETNQATLDKNQPVPTLTHSLERDNLIARLKLLNNSNQLGYVYLLGLNGSVVAHYTIKGKVTSLNSFLTTTDQLRCGNAGGSTPSCVAAASPDMDGSYGNNPSGIFFFTTSGSYIEWSGTYIYSTQQMDIQTPVSLTETVK